MHVLRYDCARPQQISRALSRSLSSLHLIMDRLQSSRSRVRPTSTSLSRRHNAHTHTHSTLPHEKEAQQANERSPQLPSTIVHTRRAHVQTSPIRQLNPPIMSNVVVQGHHKQIAKERINLLRQRKIEPGLHQIFSLFEFGTSDLLH